MSRILLIYSSKHGQTFAITQRIAQRLRADDHDVEVHDASMGVFALPVPNAFDLVVLGSSVYFGKHARNIEAYVRTHRAQLGRRRSAFFSVSMSAGQAGAGADPNGYLADTLGRLGWKPDAKIAFAGALRYPEYNWITRLVMKAIARRAGHPTDTSRVHVFTDNAIVDAFAVQLGRLVVVPPVIRA